MNIIDLTREEDINADPTSKEPYNRFFLGDSKKRSNCSIEVIEVNKKRVKNYLEISEKSLTSIGLDTSNLFAKLVVGSGAAYGYALFDAEHGHAWFAVEEFGTELKAKSFVMHELIHALHCQMAPSFWHTSPQDQLLVSRKLIIEGLATYATKTLSNLTCEESLWADMLSMPELNQWMELCRRDEDLLYGYALCHFGSSDPDFYFFSAHDRNSLTGFRQGYYVGLRVIEGIAMMGYSINDLLSMPSNDLTELARDFLQRNASKQ
jgi:hypothetical protein